MFTSQMVMYRAALLVGLLPFAGALYGNVRLGMPFSDHLVLQAHQPVPVWGTADVGETVTVEFAGQIHIVTAGANGDWRVTLDPLDYTLGNNASQTLVVRGSNELRVTDVLVGEVWLCSGQSNMRFTLGRRAEPRDAAAPLLFPASLAASTRPQIRLLNVSGGSPPNRCWAVSTPETAQDFSAIGQFFGTALQRARQVPVGLIDLGRGGASIRSFLPAAVIASNPEFSAAFPVERRSNYADGAVFAGDLISLAPFAMRGVLWYQGESDVGRATIYPELLSAMIGAWRKAFDTPELPFLIVQLPTWERRRIDPPKPVAGMKWALLREAQTHVAETVPGAHLIVSLDLGERLDIHPRRKLELGERLAALARARVYGENILHEGPVLQSVVLHPDRRMMLTFSNTEGGLLADGDRLDTFEVAGPDNVFVQAEAEIVGHDQITVTAPDGIVATSVRYGWYDWFVPTLRNGHGWPARPFHAVAR